MDEMLMPDWIKQIKAEDDLSNARNDAERDRHRAAEVTVIANGPDFWKQLLKELKITVDNLDAIRCRGSLTIMGDPRVEQTCRVLVARKSIIPNQTYTDLFYSLGSMAIRCMSMDGPLPNLSFCVCPKKGVSLVSDEHLSPMNTEEAAQLIVQRMVNMVRG